MQCYATEFLEIKKKGPYDKIPRHMLVKTR